MSGNQASVQDMIIRGAVERWTRRIPATEWRHGSEPKPYSNTQVECPVCHMQWEIVDASIKPGHVMPCGNAECQAQLRFPHYGGEPYGPEIHSKGTVFCEVEARRLND